MGTWPASPKTAPHAHSQTSTASSCLCALTSDVLVSQRQTTYFTSSTVSVFEQRDGFKSGLIDIVAPLNDVSFKVDGRVVDGLIQRVIGKEDAKNLVIDSFLRDDTRRSVAPAGRCEGHDHVCASNFALDGVCDCS
jgi:hypothetical protein